MVGLGVGKWPVAPLGLGYCRFGFKMRSLCHCNMVGLGVEGGGLGFGYGRFGFGMLWLWDADMINLDLGFGRPALGVW